MQQDQSPDYFRRRADEEQEAAANAADERAASLHRQMAEEYRKCAENGSVRPPLEEEAPAGTLHAEFRILP
jgi:hypothetical protein